MGRSPTRARRRPAIDRWLVMRLMLRDVSKQQQQQQQLVAAACHGGRHSPCLAGRPANPTQPNPPRPAQHRFNAVPDSAHRRCPPAVTSLDPRSPRPINSKPDVRSFANPRHAPRTHSERTTQSCTTSLRHDTTRRNSIGVPDRGARGGGGQSPPFDWGN